MDAWTVDFSVLTTRARRQWNNVFKGTNNCPIMKIIVPKIVYLEKLSFKNKCGEDIFKYKKTKFIIRSILKKLKNFSQGMSVYERNAKQRY